MLLPRQGKFSRPPGVGVGRRGEDRRGRDRVRSPAAKIRRAVGSSIYSTSGVHPRIKLLPGCSSNANGGRARPAEDFRGVHGPDPESCGRARSTREVDHLVRRRDVARESRPALA